MGGEVQTRQRTGIVCNAIHGTNVIPNDAVAVVAGIAIGHEIHRQLAGIQGSKPEQFSWQKATDDELIGGR